MARTLRHVNHRLKALGGLLPLGAMWILPLSAGLAAALTSTFDAAVWAALFTHPQIFPALALSLTTGSASMILSTLLAFLIVAGLHRVTALQTWMGGFLAVPHLAFAVGFSFLIMPSGLLARVVGVFGDWAAPPQWITTQDPLGLSLIVALVLKEVPFVTWLTVGLMARRDVSQMLEAQSRIGHSLGHGAASLWLRVFIPQILPRMRWPLLIVWIYGASVVDMAIAIGPTQPPPLAVIIWSDLNSADQAINARGSVGAVFLTLVLAALAVLFAGLTRLLKPTFRSFLVSGPSVEAVPVRSARGLLMAIAAVYLIVIMLLAIMSFGSLWPFPDLWPSQFQVMAWEHLWDAPEPLFNSLTLALGSMITALFLAILWFEEVSARFDRYLLAAAVVALALPSLLIAEGQYLVFLKSGLNGTWWGVYLAHLSPVFAYVFIVLSGPYRAFDPRYRSVSLGLNTNNWRFWTAIKLPIMKPALTAAAAVGIGVSIAQFESTQLIASGRLSTLNLEAVTLSSGGNRQLLAMYSLLLMIIPFCAFLAASRTERRLQ